MSSAVSQNPEADLQMDEVSDGASDGGLSTTASVHEEGQSNIKLPPEPQNHAPWPAFSVVVELLEQLDNAVTKKQRHDDLRKFIEAWRKKVGLNIYPAMRLLLPSRDRDRIRYGLKQNTLARIYIKVLGLSEKSEAAKGLVDWIKPSTNSTVAGDFAATLYRTLVDRSTVTRGRYDVFAVNRMLDEISKESSQKGLTELLSTVFQDTTPLEQKWLAKIITREMRIGMTEQSILGIFHRDAVKLFDVCSNLKKVCFMLADPKTQYDQAISLGEPYKPMLCNKEMNKLSKLLRQKFGSGFWIEDKLDGHRMQLHYYQKNGKPEFKWYTRQGIDETANYGAGHKFRGSLAPTILQHAPFKAGIKEIILDGEMMSYSNTLHRYLPFTEVKTAAKNHDVEDINTPTPCYIVFDILYVNGTSLVDYKLSERRKALEAYITPIPTKLLIHPFRTAKNLDHIIPELERIIEHGDEGIVLKDPDAKYQIGKRGKEWIKVKPEYLDDYGENAKVVIVGAQYAEGKRRHEGNPFSSYLLGLKASEDDKKPNFITFAIVGVGIKARDQEKIIKAIPIEKWEEYDRNKPPPGISFPKSAKNRPHVWVKPEDSVLIKVKAARTELNDDFPARSTWYLPRFVNFLSGEDEEHREELTWKDADTIADLYQMNKVMSKKITAKDFEDAGKDRGTVKKAASKNYSILDTYRNHDDSNVVVKSDLFAGFDFRIISTKGSVQKAYEVKVKEYGGRYYQDERAGVNMHVVADDLKNFRASAVKRQGTFDIILPEWIDDCIEEGEVLPLHPDYLLFTSKETQKHFDKVGVKEGSARLKDKGKKPAVPPTGFVDSDSATDTEIDARTEASRASERRHLSDDDSATDNEDNWRFEELNLQAEESDHTTHDSDDAILVNRKKGRGVAGLRQDLSDQETAEESHGVVRRREDLSDEEKGEEPPPFRIREDSSSSDEGIDLSVRPRE